MYNISSLHVSNTYISSKTFATGPSQATLKSIWSCFLSFGLHRVCAEYALAEKIARLQDRKSNNCSTHDIGSIWLQDNGYITNNQSTCAQERSYVHLLSFSMFFAFCTYRGMRHPMRRIYIYSKITSFSLGYAPGYAPRKNTVFQSLFFLLLAPPSKICYRAKKTAHKYIYIYVYIYFYIYITHV